MLELLKIEDLGVIADTELPLGAGFTAITGETGAGKTMIINALGLLMGERSDQGAVRSGADKARVMGILTTSDQAVIETVEDAGGELDEGELSIVRTVSSEGRSRASVGGVGAPAQVLQKIATRLFAVHGQSEQFRLKTAAAQREALDRFGGQKLLTVLEEYSRIFLEAKNVAQKLQTLQEELFERRREAETLQLEIAEISEADPQEGEIIELKAVIEKLSNVEELRESTQTAKVLLSGGTAEIVSVSVAEGTDAATQIAAAERELERASQKDKQLESLHEELGSIAVQLDEIVRSLADYGNSLDFDGPHELAKASDRLETLTALTRKYGETENEIIAYLQRAKARLLELESDDFTVEKLGAQLDELTAEQELLQAKLTASREEAAEKFSKEVTSELQKLALPDAEIIVELTPGEPTVHGAETVTILMSPHPGAPPRAVAKGASGGELSRVMLAIEVVLAGKDAVDTFVFDEVDAGIGGQAAIEVGKRLAKLAKSAQVIVVTHLAQVAAFANNHIALQKDSDGTFTKSSCKKLSDEERVSEIARLLSGMTDSQSALEHAEELLAMRE